MIPRSSTLALALFVSVIHRAPIRGFYEEKHTGTRSFWPLLRVSESPNRLCRSAFLALVSVFAVAAALAAHAQTSTPHPCFELLTHRMDVDVDGAPNAYGPPEKPTLDVLINAHYRERADQKIVGYLLDDMQHPI